MLKNANRSIKTFGLLQIYAKFQFSLLVWVRTLRNSKNVWHFMERHRGRK